MNDEPSDGILVLAFLGFPFMIAFMFYAYLFDHVCMVIGYKPKRKHQK